MKINGRFWILTTLIVLLICGVPLVTHAQLFDGEREGLLIGGGLGYAVIAVDNDWYSEEFSVSGFTTTARIGYGLSDQLTIYCSSTVPNIVPGLGLMYFPDRRSDYYLQGFFRYTSDISYDEDALLIAGGLGYQLRDQVTLEGMLGFNGFLHSGSNDTSVITIEATFNVYFY